MRLRFIGVLVGSLLLANACAQDSWESLLDDELSQWDTYLGYPNPETKVTGLPQAEDGQYSEPVGYNKDELNVFSVSTEKGEPVLRISGEIYGGIFTQREFENYHLRLQVKWGEKKWPPRADLPLDSGILYHGIGEHGVDYWRAWPLSQEFQIVEEGVDGTTGDWWKIADSRIAIRCQSPGPEQPHQFDPEFDVRAFGGEEQPITCRASANHEKPSGEWNTLDLYTFGDKSLHVVNGEVVMALTDSAYPEGDEIKPLTKGQIVLQSEAGEVFYRRIELRPIGGIPEAYQHYFE